jgi:hypothetical protein
LITSATPAIFHHSDRKSLHTLAIIVASTLRQNQNAPRSASRKSPATDAAR